MTMKTEPPVEALVAWCKTRDIALCVLFGSRARGQARPDSDYDLALKPGHPPAPLDRVAWQVEIENLLGADVSLVLLTPTTDPVLGWEIARDGKLLYERDRGLWMGEQARLWHLYNDALPFRRALAESLRSYAEEVRHGA
jgi:predicted nucleotidyltransferase